MKIFVGPRLSKKTTKLIEMCAKDKKNGVYSLIVCAGKTLAENAYDMARKSGYDIPMPITLDEFALPGRDNSVKYYIDNLDLILEVLSRRAGISRGQITGCSINLNLGDEIEILQKEIGNDSE